MIVHARAYEASHLPQRDVFDVLDWAHMVFKWGRVVVGGRSTASNQLDPLWYQSWKNVVASLVEEREGVRSRRFFGVEIGEEEASQDEGLAHLGEG